jgi:hypothetical protein
LQIGAILITDPLVPLAIDPGSFALVPLKPLRMVQTSIFTSKLMPEIAVDSEFKACLRKKEPRLRSGSCRFWAIPARREIRRIETDSTGRVALDQSLERGVRLGLRPDNAPSNDRFGSKAVIRQARRLMPAYVILSPQ